MRNQFIYSEKGLLPPTEEGEEPKEIMLRHSFNVDLVKRVFSGADGQAMVVLADIHERLETKEKIKNGRKSQVRERDTFQTEIMLSAEDAERFFKLTDISN
jgi:hypothetical protein